jgi:predicted phage tail protein
MSSPLANTLGCAVAVLGVMATLAGAATMTCIREPQTVRSSPSGGQAIRTDCLMARGADGHEVPVLVPKAKVGERLDCAVIYGKRTCT